MKFVVVLSSIFMVERELVASSRTFVSFYQFIFPKPEILEEMWDSVVPLNIRPFHPSGK